MIRRPPRSTRTDTLFPYTTLFRSGIDLQQLVAPDHPALAVDRADPVAVSIESDAEIEMSLRDQLFEIGQIRLVGWVGVMVRKMPVDVGEQKVMLAGQRSEERRVGKECVSTCRSRWSPYH